MCEVRSRKNGQEQKRKKRKKSTVVSSKKKSTVMSPIRRRMKKRNPSSGQNGQLVHWWLLIHSGPTIVVNDYLFWYFCKGLAASIPTSSAVDVLRQFAGMAFIYWL
jgi:hypothetical protein